MTNEEINLAIAEACGWVNFILPSQDEYYFLTDLELGRAMGKAVGRNFSLHKDGLHYPLTNYCKDLNAMHEVEKTLYRGMILKEYYSCGHGRFKEVLRVLFNETVSATARQRAEAFLRTIGKWKEEA